MSPHWNDSTAFPGKVWKLYVQRGGGLKDLRNIYDDTDDSGWHDNHGEAGSSPDGA